MGAGPELTAGPDGLVCAVCDWTSQRELSGDITGQVVAVVSTDWGHSFAAPVRLGSESSVVVLPGDVMPNSGPTVQYAYWPDGQIRTVTDTTTLASYTYDQAGRLERPVAERNVGQASVT